MALAIPVFKTGALGRSAIPPEVNASWVQEFYHNPCGGGSPPQAPLPILSCRAQGKRIPPSRRQPCRGPYPPPPLPPARAGEGKELFTSETLPSTPTPPPPQGRRGKSRKVASLFPSPTPPAYGETAGALSSSPSSRFGRKGAGDRGQTAFQKQPPHPRFGEGAGGGGTSFSERRAAQPARQPAAPQAPGRTASTRAG